MTVEVRLVDEAIQELEDAAHWYEDRSEGLGLVFVAALDRAVESIMRWPQAAALVEGVSAVPGASGDCGEVQLTGGRLVARRAMA